MMLSHLNIVASCSYVVQSNNLKIVTFGNDTIGNAHSSCSVHCAALLATPTFCVHVANVPNQLHPPR